MCRLILASSHHGAQEASIPFGTIVAQMVLYLVNSGTRKDKHVTETYGSAEKHEVAPAKPDGASFMRHCLDTSPKISQSEYS